MRLTSVELPAAIAYVGDTRWIDGNSRGADGVRNPLRPEAAPGRPRALSARADVGAALPLQPLLPGVRQDPVPGLAPEAQPLRRGLPPRVGRMRGADRQHRRRGTPPAPPNR